MSNILQRRTRLESARTTLKEEFVGIDEQIDEIVELTHSWYCFPEGQIRPTVVNLVGMTGVGKTSVVERLFQLLEMENVYYKLDMGYYAKDTENLKHELSKKVKNYDGSPFCFVLDEFQLCRSIDEHGDEVDRSNFRPIWDLLDNGKLNLIEPNNGAETLHMLMVKLEHCIAEGVTSKGLTITNGAKYFVGMFGKDAFDEEEYFDIEAPKTAKTPTMVPSNYFYYIQQCAPNRFVGEGELHSYLSSLKDEDSIVNFLRETIEQAIKPKIYDFSSSIIFVIANVDKAFVSSRDMDPDMDADEMHERSLEVGLFDIKQCLGKMFRSEQVARLGNNYVIYTAFSSASYRALIDLELRKKSDAVKSKFDIDIVFDRSIKKTIYSEGVFPAQGARPVFTTINYMVGSFVGRILAYLEENGMMQQVGRLEWSHKNGRNKIAIREKTSMRILGELTYDVKIKLDKLRRSKLNDEQALTSVHEAGHAVVAAALLGHVPSKIMSSTAGGSAGFNVINWNDLKGRDYVMAMASVYLAGIEAERLVFGVEHVTTQGSEGDMKAVTELVSEMVQNSGLWFPVMSHPRPKDNDTEKLKDDTNRTTRKIEEILEKAKATAVATLKQHRKVLEALSVELFRRPVLDKKKVAEIFRNNGLEVEEKNVDRYKNILLEMERNMNA